MSPTPAQRRTGTGRYHHGDLRAALVGAAVELIAERGVRDFSLAELSRRLDVSVAALA
jgi:AcrR family transcriptional regulator